MQLLRNLYSLAAHSGSMAGSGIVLTEMFTPLKTNLQMAVYECGNNFVGMKQTFSKSRIFLITL